MLLRNVMTSQTSFVYAQVVNRSKIQLEQGGWWLTYVQQIQKTFHKCEMKTIIIWSIKTISRTAQGSVDYQVRGPTGSEIFLALDFLKFFGPGTTFLEKKFIWNIEF